MLVKMRVARLLGEVGSDMPKCYNAKTDQNAFAQCGSLYAAFYTNLITTENKRKRNLNNIDIANSPGVTANWKLIQNESAYTLTSFDSVQKEATCSVSPFRIPFPSLLQIVI